MHKLYCYVDETGQDTEGQLFLVSVVITEEERDTLIEILETIEKASGKGKVKWIKAKDKARVAYIKAVLSEEKLKGSLHYGAHRNAKDYLPKTVLTTAKAVLSYPAAAEEYQVTVLVDGLPKAHVRWFGKELRHLGVRTRKVSRVRKEENDALMRLADAIAGFTRAAISGRTDLAQLLKKAKENGTVVEV